jgi:acetyl-CoA synthetase
MRDYETVYRELSVEILAREILHGSLTGLNAAIECCDRWAADGRIALRWISRDFEEETVTFETLREQSSRFANLLRARGIGCGDVVGGLLPRIPELLVVAIGTWRIGAIYQPLFTAFGPAAIANRITAGKGSQAKLIVTDASNRPKLDDVAGCPPALVVGSGDRADFAAALSAQSPDFAPVLLRGDDPFITLFTSGTTGHPKGVRHPLRMLLPTAVYMRDGLDLRPEDRYWNMADPGWGYGMITGVVGPLLIGHATILVEGGFAVETAVRAIGGERITNLAAAPTVFRMMMAAGAGAVAPIAGQLRVASSAGEPLNPEIMRWAARVLRVPLHDHYGQTETGMMMNNHHGLRHPLKAGAAGLAMPGFSLAVLDDLLNPVPPGTPGNLAVDRRNSPLFPFDGYWHAETPSFRQDWYLTGDTMQQDADGHFFFVGRKDDIINSSGYRIGPFDVESVIIEHPSVAEVAVVGKPDPERTEIVKAFIVLRPGTTASDALKIELQNHVRSRLALHAYPREIDFIAELPKTPSGKVQRFMLLEERHGGAV